MNHFTKVFNCFPSKVKAEFERLGLFQREDIEEIRVYREGHVQVFAGGNRLEVKVKITDSDINNLLNAIMKFSYYAYEEDIAKGFITIDGGHRVGICGKCVIENGHVRLIRDVSSLNIRYSKEIIGAANPVMKYIFNKDDRLNNMLIVGSPGCGKTTLIRDIGRVISQRNYKVGICDERSEIAGVSGGHSSYTFGPMVDILDGCPKAEGMMMLIRAMSEDIILTDEIGRPEDVKAIETCLNSGVKVVTTIHGSTFEDLKKSVIANLVKKHTFDYIIFLSDTPSIGSIREVVS